MPVVAVATTCHVYPKMLSNIQEVRARGAEVIAVATEGDERDRRARRARARGARRRPELLSPVVVTVPLQLLAYHVATAARLRRRPAAEPREERHGRVARRDSRGADARLPRLAPRLRVFSRGIMVGSALGGRDICEIARRWRRAHRRAHPDAP